MAAEVSRLSECALRIEVSLTVAIIRDVDAVCRAACDEARVETVREWGTRITEGRLGNGVRRGPAMCLRGGIEGSNTILRTLGTRM